MPTADDEDDSKSGDEAKPQGLLQARDGAADDLKKISGVGPKLEEDLTQSWYLPFRPDCLLESQQCFLGRRISLLQGAD